MEIPNVFIIRLAYLMRTNIVQNKLQDFDVENLYVYFTKLQKIKKLNASRKFQSTQ